MPVSGVASFLIEDAVVEQNVVRPSRVDATSTTIHSTPSAIEASNVGLVFSGAHFIAPRCAVSLKWPWWLEQLD